MPKQPRLSTTARRAGVVFALCAAFVLAALASGPIVAATERWIGAGATRTSVTAWFADSHVADRGFAPGDHPSAVVVATTDGKILVSQLCGKTLIAVRSVTGSRGRELHMLLGVPTRCAGSWLTLRIEGTRLPLQAWVR